MKNNLNMLINNHLCLLINKLHWKELEKKLLKISVILTICIIIWYQRNTIDSDVKIKIP